VRSRVRWIQLTTAGLDGMMDSPVWAQAGVQVTNTTGLHARAIPPWVLAIILQHAHKLEGLWRYHESRDWSGARNELRGRVLSGQTLGVLGLGSIGRECARLARAFDMRVLATRRSPSEPSRSKYVSTPADGVEVLEPSGLDRVLAESDYLAITLPL